MGKIENAVIAEYLLIRFQQQNSMTGRKYPQYGVFPICDFSD